MWKSVATVVATVALSLLCVSSWAAQPARLAHKAPPIGIKVVPVNGDVASLLNLRPARGLLVVLVLPDSAAAQAGLARDDVILSANGTDTDSKDRLSAALQSSDSHHLVLKVWRVGSVSEVTIEPELRSLPTSRDSDARAASP